jgi:hypothetical protein
MEKQKVWIRVAGHATRIKEKHPHGWRCYIEGNSAEIALKDWSMSGITIGTNFIPGFSATKDKHGLVAWIDCFGSYTIENEVLHITLEEPTTPPPAYHAQ